MRRFNRETVQRATEEARLMHLEEGQSIQSTDWRHTIDDYARITPLEYAIHMGDPRLVDKAIHEGADVNYPADFPPLISAIYMDRSRYIYDLEFIIFEKLLVHGANVNFQDVDGYTPLH
jgi:hypothetical protein